MTEDRRSGQDRREDERRPLSGRREDDDRRSGRDRRGRGRPKGGRRLTDPIIDLATHQAPHVTVGQLSDYWGRHPSTIGDYIREGRLEAKRVGWEYIVTTKAALQFERADVCWRKRIS